MATIRSSFVCSTVIVVALLAASRALGDAIRFPTFGIGCDAPAHSMMVPQSSPTRVAYFRFDESSGFPGAAFCIDLIPGTDQTLDQFTSDLVAKSGAKLDPGQFKIDKEKAFKVLAPIGNDPSANQKTYLVAHGNRIYMISSFNSRTADASQAVDALLPSIKFFVPEPPLKHLDDFNESPWPILGRVTIAVPACMRIMSAGQSDVALRADDYSTSPMTHPLSIGINTIQLKKQVSFDVFREDYASHLQVQLGLRDNAKLAWHEPQGSPAMHITDTLKTTVKTADGWQANQSVKFAIFELSPGSFVQFVITCNAQTDEQSAAFEKMSEHVLASVQPMPK